MVGRLLLVVFTVLAMAVAGSANTHTMSSTGAVSASAWVTWNGSGWACKVQMGTLSPNATATATYTNQRATTGWGLLEVWTDTNMPQAATNATVKQMLAFGVGCVEAAVTAQDIETMVHNAQANMFPATHALPSMGVLLLDLQLGYMRTAVALNLPHAQGMNQTFWTGAAVVLAQFDGLVAGFNAAMPASNVTAIDLYALSSADDLETFQDAVGTGDALRAIRELAEAMGQFAPMKEARVWANTGAGIPHSPMPGTSGHCSAYIKPLSAKEVVATHTTWAPFWQMLRIFKTYHLTYAPAGTMMMSSYPGILFSGDDFYSATATQLTIMETTNDIYNTTLYNKLSALAAFTWQRALLSTLFATSGEEWTGLFSMFQSGSYPCQWMVVDYKTIGSGANLVWIAEQIPGYTHTADVSSWVAAHGYWASYNIPYFADVYDMSGYPAMLQQYGDSYSWAKCSRAMIFARNNTAVSSVADVQALIRYNNYEHDPLSGGNPMHAISSRGDLANPPVLFGSYDGKLTSNTMLADGLVLAQSGPTHDQLPPFNWSMWSNVSYVGEPIIWDFDWIKVQPTL